MKGYKINVCHILKRANKCLTMIGFVKKFDAIRYRGVFHLKGRFHRLHNTKLKNILSTVSPSFQPFSPISSLSLPPSSHVLVFFSTLDTFGQYHKGSRKQLTNKESPLGISLEPPSNQNQMSRCSFICVLTSLSKRWLFSDVIDDYITHRWQKENSDIM